MISKISEDIQKVKEAIVDYVKVVASTAGRRGNDVILNSSDMLRIIKDGVKITKYFADEDPIRDIGRKMVVDVAETQRRANGDGTTATTILFGALCSGEGPKEDSYAYVQGMEQAKDDIVAELKSLALPIEQDGKINMELLNHVANIAMNGHELAPKVAELVAALGKDGKIKMSKGVTPNTVITREAGFKLDWGIASPYMQNTIQGLELENPMVVVTNEEITKYDQHLEPILSKWIPFWNPDTKMGRPLVIFCKDISDEALRYVLANLQKFPVVAIRVTAGPLRASEQLNDLKVAVKADKVYSRETGVHTKNFTGKFGSIKRLEATTGKCVLVLDDDADLSAINQEIRKELETVTDDAKQKVLRERLIRNTGGFGHISVGKKTDIEQDNLFEVLDDGQRACFAGLDGGILPGGGNALVVSAKKSAIVKILENDQDFKRGYYDVLNACFSPWSTILSNANINEPSENTGGAWHGIDVSTGEVVNLLEYGIIDPTKVVVGALENAVSAAKSLHRSKYIVTLE